MQQREHESQWAAINSIAGKIGCSGETLRKRVRQVERDAGKRDRLTISERDRIKQLESSAASMASTGCRAY